MANMALNAIPSPPRAPTIVDIAEFPLSETFVALAIGGEHVADHAKCCQSNEVIRQPLQVLGSRQSNPHLDDPPPQPWQTAQAANFPHRRL